MIAFLFPLAGCRPAIEGGEGERELIATIEPVAALLRDLARGRAEVYCLLPRGASPHVYEPRPSDVRRAERALAMIYVGEEIDGWGARLPSRLRISLLEVLGEAAGEEASRGIEPHFWTDPALVAMVVRPLAERLAGADPAGRGQYEANADLLERDLAELNEELAAIFAPVRGAAALATHPAFENLFRRHGLRSAAVLEPHPGKEPSPRFIGEVIAEGRAAGVKAVFTQPELSMTAARTVAEALDARVFELDPLGGGPGRETYRKTILHNARIIAEAVR